MTEAARIAEQYMRDLEKKTGKKHEVVLSRHVLTETREPRIFAGFHKLTRRPLYTHDVRLGKRFSPDDTMMIAAFAKHLRESHHHDVFAVLVEA